MELRYHTNSDSFYDIDGNLYPNPTQTLDELEKQYQEAITKYKELKTFCSTSGNECDEFDKELLRFNLGNFIENLEWKIDLKLLHHNLMKE